MTVFIKKCRPSVRFNVAHDSADITGLLKAWGRGDRGALDQLTPLVYDHLRLLARRHMRKEPAGHGLQPTALGARGLPTTRKDCEVDWQDRAHFFAVSARMMRRMLVDHARARASTKRGGQSVHGSIPQPSASTNSRLPNPNGRRSCVPSTKR